MGDEAQAQKVLDSPVGDKLPPEAGGEECRPCSASWRADFALMINNVRPVLTPGGREGRENRVHAEPGLYRDVFLRRGQAVPMAWG